MGYLAALPEGCISEILSRTTPLDATRSLLISKGFKSAAESDPVWETFLPSDYEDIISESLSPVVYSTKKDLYFTLCDFPILLHGGNMSFSLDKRTGKKCYMVGARLLPIAWGDNPSYWKWASHHDSRFGEVAELRFVCWLDIRGEIDIRKLSPQTPYAAYLVFKLSERRNGLASANATVRFIDKEADNEAEAKAITVHLESQMVQSNRWRQDRQVPRKRLDGWMEVKLGEFYNEHGDDGEVEARLIEITRLHGKFGLIVEGIQFRPKEDV